MATTAPSIAGATQADTPVGLDALSLHETVRTGPLTLFSVRESATGEAETSGDDRVRFTPDADVSGAAFFTRACTWADAGGAPASGVARVEVEKVLEPPDLQDNAAQV